MFIQLTMTDGKQFMVNYTTISAIMQPQENDPEYVGSVIYFVAEPDNRFLVKEKYKEIIESFIEVSNE